MQTTFDSLNDILVVSNFSDQVTKQQVYKSFVDEMRDYLNCQVIIVYII
jgi:hypothetical protein